MALEQGKTKYVGKCAKCGREIRIGWTVFYDAENKKVYCKPCGEQLSKQVSSQKVESESGMLINELVGDVRLINDMVASQGLQLTTILETVANIEKQATALGKAIATLTVKKTK